MICILSQSQYTVKIAGDADQPMKQLTITTALKLVSSFFEEEWPQSSESELELRKVFGGFMNRLHLLSRSNVAIKEPGSVLIRQFGTSEEIEEPFERNSTLSAAEQALMYHEMGCRGWGPKVYGLFRGGRLEEYIDAHVLTPAESTIPEIRQDLARSYARVHSIHLPLRRDTFKSIIREFEQGAHKSSKTVEALLAIASPDSKELGEFVKGMNWKSELAWITEMLEKHDCKKTIAIGDTNFHNVLVKNYESECRVILIDYETATYGYRGMDIGGHFSERSYDWSHPDDVLTGCSSPDLQEKISFCESYLQEMRDLDQELDGRDTVEHLLLESQIGQLYQMLFTFLLWIMSDDLEDYSHHIAGYLHMAKVYHKLRHDGVAPAMDAIRT